MKPRHEQQLRRVQRQRASRPVAYPRHEVQAVVSFDFDYKPLAVAMSAARRQPTNACLSVIVVVVVVVVVVVLDAVYVQEVGIIYNSKQHYNI